MKTDLLTTQRENLVKLEKAANDLFDNAPWVGHGGTPFVDNSTGRRRRVQADKHNDRIRSAMKAIENQKEKIERTINRQSYKAVPTKKSEQFIERNPISPVLLHLEKQGKVQQWAKNPQFFFVKSLKKVALISVGDRVGVAKRFCATTQEDMDFCKEMIATAQAELEVI